MTAESVDPGVTCEMVWAKRLFTFKRINHQPRTDELLDCVD